MLHGKLKIEICKTVLQILCKLGPSSLTYPLGIIFLAQYAVHHINILFTDTKIQDSSIIQIRLAAVTRPRRKGCHSCTLLQCCSAAGAAVQCEHAELQ